MDTRHKSAARFTAILVGGALASKMLGFAREVLMAHVLGASMVADGFRGAHRGGPDPDRVPAERERPGGDDSRCIGRRSRATMRRGASVR